jgi:long-chain acyl-CoA synthetase
MVIGSSFGVQTRLASTEAPLGPEDCYVSYLPAAHSFEQIVFGISIIYGMKCGFFAGNMLKLTEDIALLHPTFFPSVPRLYNKIYAKIKDGITKQTGVKGWLVNRAIVSKLYYLKNG